MAMTFTLVSHLREQLSILVRVRAEIQENAKKEKERLALEVSRIPCCVIILMSDLILGRGSSDAWHACDH